LRLRAKTVPTVQK